MKAIISSSVLRKQLGILLKNEITEYRTIDHEIYFLCETIKGKVTYYEETIHCHVMEYGDGVFDERKWINLYKFLGNLAEQPIVVEFDDNITISEFVIVF